LQLGAVEAVAALKLLNDDNMAKQEALKLLQGLNKRSSSKRSLSGKHSSKKEKDFVILYQKKERDTLDT
jgi:hypothetical protein